MNFYRSMAIGLLALLYSTLVHAQFTTSGSNLYHLNGNVGIGTTTSNYKLTVLPAARGQIGFSLNDPSFSHLPRAYMGTTINGAGYIEFRDGPNQTQIKLSASGDSYINAGKLGIGNANPVNKLDITGEYITNHFDAQLHLHTTNNTHGMYLGSHSATYGAISQGSYYQAAGNFTAKGSYASGIIQNNGYFHFFSNSGLSNGSVFSPTMRLSISNSGNVGIGTTSPSKELHVIGDGLIESGSGAELNLLNTSSGRQWQVVSGTNAGFEIGNVTDNLIDTNAPFFISKQGRVGLGTVSPTEKLEVNGNVLVQGKVESNRVRVTQNPGNWPDYVFSNDYKLRSLDEVQAFIEQHKHLPEVPSAEEVGKNGLDLGNMDATLLKKVEELTLYLLDQNQQIETVNARAKTREKRMKELEAENEALKLRLDKLESLLKGLAENK